MIIEQPHVKRGEKYYLPQHRQVYYKAEVYKFILQVPGYLI